MGFQIINMRMISTNDPQIFELFFKDLEEHRKGYVLENSVGTEAALRKTMLDRGIPLGEVELWFLKAK
jgi:hypothetical protein